MPQPTFLGVAGSMGCRQSPIAGPGLSDTTAEPWGSSGSERQRRHFGLDDNADRPSETRTVEGKNLLFRIRAENGPSGQVDTTTEDAAPERFESVEHNDNLARTRSLDPSYFDGRFDLVWREVEALRSSTFPRFYNKLIWSRSGSAVGDEDQLVPSSRRWRFQGKGPTSKESMNRAQLQIVELLKEDFDIRKAKLAVTFPREGRKHFVEVHFSTFKAFRAAATMNVSVGNEMLEQVRAARPTRLGQILITVHQVKPQRARELWLEMRRKLEEQVEFQHLWARRKEEEWTDDKRPLSDARRSKRIENTITLVGLSVFRPGHDAKHVPGFIRDEHNTSYTLHYEGRGGRCTFCRDRATDRHTVEQCSQKRCIRCEARGHFAKDCALPSRMEDDLDL